MAKLVGEELDKDQEFWFGEHGIICSWRSLWLTIVKAKLLAACSLWAHYWVEGRGTPMKTMRDSPTRDHPTRLILILTIPRVTERQRVSRRIRFVNRRNVPRRQQLRRRQQPIKIQQ